MRDSWLCAIAVVLLGSGVGWGATITVTTTEPGIVGDGLCSLAEAVENANDGSVHSDCIAGDHGLDVIELGHEAIYSQAGDLVVTDDIGINGHGSTIESWRLGIGDEASCSMNDLTVDRWTALSENGRLFVNGCAISLSRVTFFSSTVVFIDTEFNRGILEGVENNDIALIRSKLISNEETWISASRVLIRDSHINGSGAYGFALSGPSQVEISGSTFSGDLLFLDAGSIVVDRSTLSGASLLIYPQDPPEETSLTIRDSTIIGRLYDLYCMHISGAHDTDISYAMVRLENNVLACGYILYIDTWGPNIVEADVQSNGFNMAMGTYGPPFLDHHTDMVVDDVMLSELGYWAGPTPTHRPLEGSPIIDMGSDDCGYLDQRGYVRPVDGDGDTNSRCDCGAVEYASQPPPEPPDLREVPIVPPEVD